VQISSSDHDGVVYVVVQQSRRDACVVMIVVVRCCNALLSYLGKKGGEEAFPSLALEMHFATAIASIRPSVARCCRVAPA